MAVPISPPSRFWRICGWLRTIPFPIGPGRGIDVLDGKFDATLGVWDSFGKGMLVAEGPEPVNMVPCDGPGRGIDVLDGKFDATLGVWDSFGKGMLVAEGPEPVNMVPCAGPGRGIATPERLGDSDVAVSWVEGRGIWVVTSAAGDAW